VTTRRPGASPPAAVPGLPDAVVGPLRASVLAWYDERRRDLPWRREPTLYGTWISEMMLQQTTVAAVVPYWRRFVARFPDVATLAAASVEEVLAHWSGLGYYRRAQHLHAAAREVVAHLGGGLPQDLAGWRALPGIGPYAAGAIASIGLGQPVPAVDANVRRVIARWLAPDAAVALPPGCLEQAAAAAVDPRRPGDWNQALMELGATVCRARSVACHECPARIACLAATGDDPAAVGRSAERRRPVPVLASALLVRCVDRVLLLPTSGVVVARVRGLGRPLRDDLAGLHQGLFALPQTPWYARDEGDAGARLAAAWREWLG
jgi:A/G-specific adenine glycosylase